MTDIISIKELFLEICKFPQMYQKRKLAISAKEHDAKRVVRNLKKFSQQLFDSFDDDIKEGLQTQSTTGMTYMPHIIWVAFLPVGCTVSKNISVAICFGKNGEGVVAGVMESKGIRQTRSQTVERSNNKMLVDVNGKKKVTKYNDMFLNPKEFVRDEIDITELISHISESIVYLKEVLKSK